MDLLLKDKVILITGGTSGIGEFIAKAFAREGSKLAVVGREPERGKLIENELKNLGAKAIFIQAELSDPNNCQVAVDACVKVFGGIDVLVNNAGVNDGASLEAGPDAFVASLYKNLVHYYAMAHYALPHLKASKGNIINIGSKVANTGQGKTSGYAASKGGIQALTREWAAGLLSDGIRVNEVIPAEVWTPLYEKWIQSLPNPETAKSEIESKIPFGKRFTTSDEIANMVVFIASEKSSHTTGQILYVDGGYTHLDRMLT